MEITLTRRSTALLASAAFLMPAIAFAEPPAQVHPAAVTETKDDVLFSFFRSLWPEADVETMSWSHSDRDGESDVYSDLVFGEMTFSEAKLTPSQNGAVSAIFFDGQGRDANGNEIAIEKMSFDGQLELLAGLRGSTSGGLSVQEGLCSAAGEITRNGLGLTGLSVMRTGDATPTPVLRLENARLNLDGEPRDGMCLARLEATLSGLQIDDKKLGSLTLGEMQIASFRPASAMLPETALGADFFDYWSLDDLAASWRHVEDALKLDFASIKVDYQSDSLLPLSGAGLNDLMRLAMDGASEGEMIAAAQPHEIWNAFRDIHGGATIDVDALAIKTDALGLLPAAVLGSKGIKTLTFDGDMSATFEDAVLKYALFQTLNPLLGMGVEVDLELGVAEAPQEDTVDSAAFYAPIALKRLDMMVDDMGIDPLLRELTGEGLPELVKDQAAMLPEEQRDAVATWVEDAIGEGRNARLRMTPDSPVEISELLPLLTGDWALLGTLMNATTMP